MKTDIPFYANPSDTHCCQATMRMGFEYFDPERKWTWDALDELTGHVEGLLTWNMRLYCEVAKLGFDTVIFDPMDFEALVENPDAYIRDAFSPEYAEETISLSDMDRAVQDARDLLAADGVDLHARSYQLDEYKALLDDGYVCATWVDSAVYMKMDKECWPHFILVYGYDANGIWAHDPGGADTGGQMPQRFIDWDMFEKANKINDHGERGEMIAFRKA